ncbi:hypothetical protein Tco_1473045, partial [Tanacetum coccineum]
MEEAYKGPGNLVDRMRNIDGKMVREGKIRKEMRGAALSQSDTFSLSQDAEVREISSAPTQNLDSNQSGPSGTSCSFASLLKNPNTATTQKAVRLQKSSNPEKVQGANVVLPLAVVEKMSIRFENTLYGYFIGNRLAFSPVENYVKNAWAKYGLEHIILKKGFFFF